MVLSKTLNWLLAIMFLVAISLPMTVMLLHSAGGLSENENRRLASLPDLEFRPGTIDRFKKQFETYFDDHFGLRSSILGLARDYKRKVFNKAISSKVYLGDSGWMYFNIDGSLRDFVGENDPTEQELRRWQDALETKQRWLATLGIRYLLMPIPGKMTTYPEYLPPRIRHLSAPTRLQRFMEYLRIAGMPDYILDLTPALAEAKSQRQLFFRTDTHWTDYGAYVGYKEAIERVSHWIDTGPVVELSKFEQVEINKRGDIARAAGASAGQTEPARALRLAEPCSTGAPVVVEGFAATQAYQQAPKKLPVAMGCNVRSDKALVVHDSFGPFLMQFLNEHFDKVVYMHSYDVYAMKSFLQQYKPDVYIDVRAARRFHLLLEPDPRMKLDLD